MNCSRVSFFTNVDFKRGSGILHYLWQFLSLIKRERDSLLKNALREWVKYNSYHHVGCHLSAINYHAGSMSETNVKSEKPCLSFSSSSTSSFSLSSPLL